MATSFPADPDKEYIVGDRIPENANWKIRDIVAYWQSLHADGRLPGRAQFDPAAVPALLPNIVLYDVLDTPSRFRIRLMGTRLVTFTGRDSTGRYIEEIHENSKTTATYYALQRVAAGAHIEYRKGPPVNYSAKRFVAIERVFLPLATDGVHVDMILGLITYWDQEGREH